MSHGASIGHGVLRRWGAGRGHLTTVGVVIWWAEEFSIHARRHLWVNGASVGAVCLGAPGHGVVVRHWDARFWHHASGGVVVRWAEVFPLIAHDGT